MQLGQSGCASSTDNLHRSRQTNAASAQSVVGSKCTVADSSPNPLGSRLPNDRLLRTKQRKRFILRHFRSKAETPKSVARMQRVPQKLGGWLPRSMTRETPRVSFRMRNLWGVRRQLTSNYQKIRKLSWDSRDGFGLQKHIHSHDRWRVKSGRAVVSGARIDGL
jgi:hypothetical protein